MLSYFGWFGFLWFGLVVHFVSFLISYRLIPPVVVFLVNDVIFDNRYAVSTRWEREVEENGPVKDFHRYFCCCARRLGNMFMLWERSDGSPIVIAGPCWPFCVFVTLVRYSLLIKRGMTEQLSRFGNISNGVLYFLENWREEHLV